MERVFEKAFTSVIRTQILQGHTVIIDGLGAFKMEHVKQQPSRVKDGKSVLNPPKDRIVFLSEGAKN
ncbi:MAG: hypothetical protein LAT57_05820 [Balneolales bacterium]|nr:hypothetical protein [Balneolales bacterium]